MHIAHMHAAIGRVTACEIEEKPTDLETRNYNLRELKAQAERILKYCMAAKVEKKERDAYALKIKEIIDEISDYLERKWHLHNIMHS